MKNNLQNWSFLIVTHAICKTHHRLYSSRILYKPLLSTQKPPPTTKPTSPSPPLSPQNSTSNSLSNRPPGAKIAQQPRNSAKSRAIPIITSRLRADMTRELSLHYAGNAPGRPEPKRDVFTARLYNPGRASVSLSRIGGTD